MAPRTGPRVNWKGKLKALSDTVRTGTNAQTGGKYIAPNHQNGTKRVLADLGVHELEGEINIIGLLILHPFVKVLRDENDVVFQPNAFTDF